MFGPDTPLVMDAIQITAIAGIGGAILAFAALRFRKSQASQTEKGQGRAKAPLEERVEVLERIATDRSIDLADEIEALRAPTPTHSQESVR